jgi:hypothetical protein
VSGKISRRAVFAVGAGATAALFAPRLAHAQERGSHGISASGHLK